MASSEVNSRLVQLVVPALDQIIKNVSRWKHPKLATDCKSVIDHLNTSGQGRTPTAAAAASPPASPSGGRPDPEGASLPGVLLDLSLSESEVILNPIIDALSLNQVKVSSHALDAVHKLILNGFLHGEPNHSGSPDGKLLAKLIDSVCKCHDSGDENVELMVIKVVLSGVASVLLRIHGDFLLHVVKTCYNIYLISNNVVSQTIAKGAMAQISAIVFRRMETDSIPVSLLPVVAAEVMEAPDKANDDGSVPLFSLGFITKIMQDVDVVNNPSGRGNGGVELGGQDVVNDQDSEGVLGDKDLVDRRYWEISIYKKALEVNKGMTENGEGEKIDDLDVQIGNRLRRDAYVVIRALCKLSMQAPPKETAVDSQTMKGKIVALELIKVLLDNSGMTFRTNESFLDAIRQYLCLSLLKNIASPLMVIFQLSCSIFISLVTWFRAGLKAEVGVFFPMIVLKVLENVAQPNYQQKLMVIQSLEKLSADSQIWIDIFLNYDCDVNATNIFERVINGLLKTAQGVSPGVSTTLQPSQVVTMKQEAMKCLIAILKSMGDWMDRQIRVPVSPSPKNAEAVDNGNDTESASPVHESRDEPTEPSETGSPSPANEVSDLSYIEQRRAYKLKLQEGISLFNRKPGKGIEFLKNANKVRDTPEEIAAFLKNASGLNRTMIGHYLGEREDLPLKVMHAYVDSFDFQGMVFDEAIRNFLQGFRLPGEAQKIDRIMEKFAQRYCKCNPNAFTSADTAYVLAYSVIMLNTDAHNPTVKNKMSAEDFIRNNRGIDDGKDLPEEYMRSLFERILKNEIKMKDDDLPIQQKQSVNSNRMLGLDAILNIVVRKRSEDILETGDELMKHLQEQFKEKAGKSESTYYPAMDVVILKFMIEACWAPMLAAFSVPLDQSDDESIISLCLEGFHIAIHITATMSMTMHRDAFITSLAKFTSLHSPADIKQKNIDAIKVIIAIADEDGNYLQEAWEHVLTCVSRFNHLHVLGEGGQPYAASFSISHNEFDKSKQAWKKGSAQSIVRRSSYDSTSIGAFPEITSAQLSNLFTKLNLLEKVGEMNHIFVQSQNLNSEAIVDFVKALCKVSIDELRSTPNLRVFSITKIVEITNYNMNRIRLVWSMIWQVLSDFFVALGCSENLSIAIYAMDTLRQISMKFLDREELANYNFQTEFMKPFVIVMRQSNAVEIRELIIRCVSQMVLSRVDNVKSGWKSMFMVFTTAAYDDHKNNVLLAFEIIEKIVRDYFPYITETETSTFTDCVNCLVAFTNSRANKEINLNSIAFLRFCAVKLSEGDLGKGTSKNDPPAEKDKNSDNRDYSDKVDYLYLWFPLLAGLSELSFDPRTEIRKSALQVLFESLHQYGHHFSMSLWEKVFDSVLCRIFDHALHKAIPYSNDNPMICSENVARGGHEDRDAGLYETCTSALQLVVDLLINFYDTVNPLLNKVLAIFVNFIKSPNQSFAGIGIEAMVRLTSKSGAMLSEDQWFKVVSSLKEAAEETLPDFMFVLTENSKLPENSNGSVLDESSGNVDEMDSLRREYLSTAILYAKSRAAIQMLLVQAMMDIYDTHGDRLLVNNTIVLFNAVHTVAFHSHKINSDMSLRPKLQELESIAQMPDPPLLRLENLSYQICLTMLQTLVSNQLPSHGHGAVPSPEVEYLVTLCLEVLQFYVEAARARHAADPPEKQQPLWAIPLSSGSRKEMAARAPLIVATLQAICSFGDLLLEKNLQSFFPLLSSLISCDHGSNKLQLVLSDMLVESVGPVLLRSC